MKSNEPNLEVDVLQNESDSESEEKTTIDKFSELRCDDEDDRSDDSDSMDDALDAQALDDEFTEIEGNSQIIFWTKTQIGEL